ncbi:hypothetical protein Btru_030461 [Bulinus truncatus]|nr:hypothetical protein Btru_030461 [Bulinus truncatus]
MTSATCGVGFRLHIVSVMTRWTGILVSTTATLIDKNYDCENSACLSYTIVFLSAGLVGGIMSLRSRRDTPKVTTVKYRITSPINNLDDLAKAVGLPQGFTLQKSNRRAIPGDNYKWQLALLYKGVTVRNFMLQVTEDKNGNFLGVVTGYYPTVDPALDTSVSRQNNELKKATADFINQRNTRAEIGPVKAKDIDYFQSQKQIYVNPATGVASVAYFCSGVVSIPKFSRNPKVLFDANSMVVIAGRDRVRYNSGESGESDSCPKLRGGNEKSSIFYGPGPDEICLNVERNGKTCSLVHDKFVVKTMDNGYDESKARVVTFDCEKGPGDGTNGAPSPSLDAYLAGYLTFSMIDDINNRDAANIRPLDPKDRMDVFVNYGQDFDNSFFNGRNIFCGDGSEITFPFASAVDVVAHEMGHAATAAFGNLQLINDSLAIDESFSDITARAVMEYGGLASPNDWTFGARVIKQDGISLRNFANPEQDGFSISHTKDLNKITSPYQASGILNKVYYLLVSQYQFSHQSVYECFYHANKIYWLPDTYLLDAAEGLVRSAKDLAKNHRLFIEALKTVGLDVEGR